MNILLLGAAGFIGTNLTMKLAMNKNNHITIVDTKKEYFSNIDIVNYTNVTIKESPLDIETDFEAILEGQQIVYHLVSTIVPTTSNQHVSQELTSNVVMTAKMLDASVKCCVDKVIFISSGGTVYGKEVVCPIKENMTTNPISSYGIQKVTIEKLLYLYQYMYGLDYRVIRLANPYGPYQRPNGVLGAVSTFTYKALKGEEIIVYGDGSVVRDFIYIEDAIKGILNIVNGDNKHRTYNLGSGYGTSIKEVLKTIQQVLKTEIKITYKAGRKVDVPVNYLDISRYEVAYGKLNPITLYDGVMKTATFMRQRHII
ncbi:MAG: NAD-dependent epimerase/dehydratase family protein [Clostridiaceae bacterium]